MCFWHSSTMFIRAEGILSREIALIRKAIAGNFLLDLVLSTRFRYY